MGNRCPKILPVQNTRKISYNFVGRNCWPTSLPIQNTRKISYDFAAELPAQKTCPKILPVQNTRKISYNFGGRNRCPKILPIQNTRKISYNFAGRNLACPKAEKSIYSLLGLPNYLPNFFLENRFFSSTNPEIFAWKLAFIPEKIDSKVKNRRTHTHTDTETVKSLVDPSAHPSYCSEG